MFARTAAAAILIAIVGYGLFKALPLLSGPSLRVEAIPGSLPGVITLSGTASRTETLTLNGGILLIDEEGSFSKTLTLPSGGAILSLTATDRFGRSTYESASVFVP
jgi:hypothetical protein